MLRLSALIMVLLSPIGVLAEDESLDLAFLEWLGETAEIEEMGVDIDELILLQEESVEDKTEGRSQ